MEKEDSIIDEKSGITYDQIQEYYYYYLKDEEDFNATMSYVALDQNKCGRTYSNTFCNIITCVCMDLEGLLRVYFQKPKDKEFTEYDYIDFVKKDECLRNVFQEKVEALRGKYKELQPLELHENSRLNKMEWTKFWPAYNRIKHQKITSITSATQLVTLNALAALYVIECYILKTTASKEKKKDFFDKESCLFKLQNLETKYSSASHLMCGEKVDMKW